MTVTRKQWWWLLYLCKEFNTIYVINWYYSEMFGYPCWDVHCRHYGNTHGKSNVLTSNDLTSFMYQIAKGMDYLSSRGVSRDLLSFSTHTTILSITGNSRRIILKIVFDSGSVRVALTPSPTLMKMKIKMILQIP